MNAMTATLIAVTMDTMTWGEATHSINEKKRDDWRVELRLDVLSVILARLEQRVILFREDKSRQRVERRVDVPINQFIDTQTQTHSN